MRLVASADIFHEPIDTGGGDIPMARGSRSVWSQWVFFRLIGDEPYGLHVFQNHAGYLLRWERYDGGKFLFHIWTVGQKGQDDSLLHRDGHGGWNGLIWKDGSSQVCFMFRLHRICRVLLGSLRIMFQSTSYILGYTDTSCSACRAAV